MKNYVGIVREGRNGNVTSITSEYNTKADFRKDIRSNGYRVIAIFTQEQVAYIKNTGKTQMKPTFLFNNYEAIEYVKQCL